MLPAVSETAGTGVVAVPFSVMLCGLPDALSVTLRLALRLPPAVGLNVTEIVQFTFGASVLGPIGHVVVCAKSPGLPPASPTLLIVRGAVPVLVTVAVCAALAVPTSCDPNVRLVGARLTAGVGVVPVPLSVTACGLFVALSVIRTLAPRAPAAVGVRLRERLHFALAASAAAPTGQLLPCT